MNKKIVQIIIVFCFSVVFTQILAQDAQFTQYFNNPIYLNPANTGNTDEKRVIANYRNQWLGLSKAFQTINISGDYKFEDEKNGVGIQVWRDMAGSSRLNTTSFGASYAYNLKTKSEIDIRSGIQVNYVSRSVNTANLVFNDQLIPNAPAVSADANTQSQRFGYLDINAGVLINKENYWAGISFSHINRPATSEIDKTSKLPMNISIHGAYKIIQARKANEIVKYIMPMFNYRKQANFDQLDVGVLYVYAPASFGIWYRGLPVKKYLPTYANNDALCFLVGMELKEYKMRIAYSYDLTMNRLIKSSTGSHELSVIYEIGKREIKAKKQVISGPKL
jgi:type IX secretion system PorP/SprF family membrane protein